MTHPAFELLRTNRIPTLNLSLEEYRHKNTKARHLHLAADDPNNAFLAAFLTVPMDSTGVAHILEHTSLCGSRRYPVRDPFFMMIRRSLNTFMNALTSSDWTAYPFASQNKKDFTNLLQVYLDAVFFPRLDELDFAQEGHRVEFENPTDPNSPLVYKGIVYNEMKGAMSSPVRALWHKVYEVLYPSVTYHYNSGGDPDRIPDLSWEQLKQFHASHYHPSNAVLMTYGDTPAAAHQEMMEECALKHFQKQDLNLGIPDEQRYAEPQYVTAEYALDGEEDTSRKTHIVSAWLLQRSTDPREVMNLLLLNGVLLNNSAAPLLYALETTSLGTAPSPLCGVDTSNHEMTFGCGLEGSEPEHAAAVEELILSVLRKVAAEGVPQDQVEAVLHQIELSQREITGDHFPYGLNLMLNALSPVLHGGDAYETLHIDPYIEALREDIRDPEFIKGLVKRMLLDNPHRVQVVMKPDTTLSERKGEVEKARLETIRAALGEDDKQFILQRAQQLQERQGRDEDPELLPKVGLEDVPPQLPIAEGEAGTVDGTPVPLMHFAQGTNGMVYQQLVVDLPALDEDLIDLLPLFCDAVTEVGVGERDYLQTQHWQSAVTGGIGARAQVRGSVSDLSAYRSIFVLSGKALARNQGALSEILTETFHRARFDELSRLRELVAQLRGDVESSITGRGSGLAMSAACSTMNATGAAAYRWSGLRFIKQIKALDDALEDDAALQAFAAKLERLRDIFIQAPRQFLLISEAQYRTEFENSVAQCWAAYPQPAAGGGPFSLEVTPTQVRQGWRTSTPVHFCAKAYPTVPYTHPDAPALRILGTFLRNGYLHRAIREQGGAYGGGAGYDQDTGSFRFYSYRDPRLSETLADFDRSLEWLLETSHHPRSLEEAILETISRIDRPASPAGEAKSAFFGRLHGRTPELRREFRQRVLQVSLDDLQRAAQTWLAPERASVAVVSNANSLEKEGEQLGLELLNI